MTLQMTFHSALKLLNQKEEDLLEVWPESHWPRFLLTKGDGLRSYTA